jgi:hypothetical protein
LDGLFGAALPEKGWTMAAATTSLGLDALFDLRDDDEGGVDGAVGLLLSLLLLEWLGW